MLRSFARRARIPMLAALALGLLAAPASASTVTGGGFDWTMANYYARPSDDPTGQRTWLGFVVNTLPLAGPPSAGSVTASGGATIVDRAGAPVTTVDGTSPAGLAETYTLSVPATGGTYDEYTGAGTINLGGTLTFAVHPGMGLLPNTIVNPTMTLDGLSGSLSASGQMDRRSYGPELGPLFTFSLQSSLVTLKPDGTRILSAISRTAASSAFFGRYPASTGTETFALRLKLKPDEVRGPKGDKGDAGTPGKTVVLQTSVLRRAPYPDGGKRHEIELLSTKTDKVVARGAVRARTIRVRLAKGLTKRLRGVYLLKAGEQPAKRVRVL
jgi:hypothetical protein